MNDVGMVDEHAPRGNTNESGTAEYSPTPEEKKLIKLVENCFEKAKRHRALYDTEWLDYYHMFRGKQWKEARPAFRHSEVVNFIFRTIQSTVPMLADPRPRFEFLPEEPSDYEFSQIMNEVAEADWQKNNWQEVLLGAMYDGAITGTALSSVQHSPRGNDGIGKVEYETEDPFHCFPDPEAQDVNKKAGYFVVAKPVPVGELKKRYPDKAQFIKADLQDMTRGQKADIGPIKFRSPVDRKVYPPGGTGQFEQLDGDKALEITCYLTPEFCEDDYEERQGATRDAEGNEQPYWLQMANWPKGRKIVIASGVLLEGDQTLYDDVKIPLQRYVNYLLPREFWGISDVEQLKGPQRLFNKVFCFALDVLTLMGNPVWINPGNSNVDSDNLLNRPGLVIEPSSTETAPYRVEGVQLQPYVLQIADKLEAWMRDVSGDQEVSQGVQPAGVTAASAITALQEAANTRVRLKSKLLDGYLQHVGQAWLSRTMQFRTAPEIFRLTNDEGATKYFRMHIEHYPKTREVPDPVTGGLVQEPTGETGHRAHYQPVGPNGQIDPEQGRVYELRGKLDVRVSTGSSLPFNKAEKETRLTKLYELGVIDEEELLKGLEYPNWQAVLQRMAEKKAAAAQAEADAQAAQAQAQAAAKAGAAPPAA